MLALPPNGTVTGIPSLRRRLASPEIGHALLQNQLIYISSSSFYFPCALCIFILSLVDQSTFSGSNLSFIAVPSDQLSFLPPSQFTIDEFTFLLRYIHPIDPAIFATISEHIHQTTIASRPHTFLS